MLAVEAQVGGQPGGVALLEHGLGIHQPGDEVAALAHRELLLLVAAQQHQGDHVRAALDHHAVEALERPAIASACSVPQRRRRPVYTWAEIRAGASSRPRAAASQAA